MFTNGWFKFHRDVWNNPVLSKDAEHIALWTYLMSNAKYKAEEVLFGGKKIVLQPGQLIVGRKKLEEILKINNSKIQRILKKFENEQQIEQKTSTSGRIITIVNWAFFQEKEHTKEQVPNNEATSNEQPVNTNKEYKNQENFEEEKNVLCDDSIKQEKVNNTYDDLNAKMKEQNNINQDSIKSENNCELKKNIQEVVNLYNSICVSFPNIEARIKNAQAKEITQRFEEGYTLNDFKNLFKKTEESSFLKGERTGWKASFNWLIISENMEKVLSNQYIDYKENRNKKKNKFHNFLQRTHDYEALETFFINKVNGKQNPKDILERLGIAQNSKSTKHSETKGVYNDLDRLIGFC